MSDSGSQRYTFGKAIQDLLVLQTKNEDRFRGAAEERKAMRVELQNRHAKLNGLSTQTAHDIKSLGDRVDTSAISLRHNR